MDTRAGATVIATAALTAAAVSWASNHYEGRVDVSLAPATSTSTVAGEAIETPRTPTAPAQSRGSPAGSPASGLLQQRDRAAEVDGLKLEVAELRREVMRLRAEITAAAPWPDGDGNPPDVPDPKQAERDAAAAHAERMQRMHEDQRRQRVDRRWAQAVGSHLRDVMAGEAMMGSSLAAVDCRSTLCRIEIVHNDEESFDAFQSQFPIMVADELPAMTMDHRAQGDGSMVTVLYASRGEETGFGDE